MKTLERTIRKSIMYGLGVFLIAGMTACSDHNKSSEDDLAYQENQTLGEIFDRDTFNNTFASNNYYEDWDANDDDFLDEDEYSQGLFSSWDINDDNRLDQNEWNTASNDFRIGDQNWTDWDANNDGYLDNNEYRDGISQNGWYRDWDADKDNRINKREYSDGLFGLWDVNRDGKLDESENRYYHTYFGV